MKQIISHIILGLMLMMACTSEKGENQVEQKEPVTRDENTVRLSQDQILAIKLKTGYIVERNLSNVIQANGYLEVPPQNKAVLSPMIAGYVRKINFLIGDDVKKGQVMAELESMEFIDLQQQYIEINAQVSFLKEAYDRHKKLRDQDAISQKTFLASEVEYTTTLSILEGLRNKLSLVGVDFNKLSAGKIDSRIKMRAPISGSVKSMNTVIGKHVDPSEELFEIVNPEHLHLELNVYERDISRVRKGQKVWFKVPNLAASNFEGEVFLVGQNLSEARRSINVHVHIHGDESIFTIGMYASASIVVEDTPFKTIPVTAVVVDGANEFVFKKSTSSSGDIVFTKIPVFTGLESEGLIELTSMDGLSSEDEIVIEGAFYLLNAFTEE